jgi:polyphosphate kinase
MMNAQGEYVKVTRRGAEALNSQKLFGKEATELGKPKDIAESRVFEPEYRDDHGL